MSEVYIFPLLGSCGGRKNYVRNNNLQMVKCWQDLFCLHVWVYLSNNHYIFTLLLLSELRAVMSEWILLIKCVLNTIKFGTVRKMCMFLSLGIAMGPSSYSSVYAGVCVWTVFPEKCCVYFFYILMQLSNWLILT